MVTGVTQALHDFISIMVSGITELGSGIGAGLSSIVTNVFLTVDAQNVVTGLSVFGGIVALMAGLALAVGLTRLIFIYITSLGARG